MTVQTAAGDVDQCIDAPVHLDDGLEGFLDRALLGKIGLVKSQHIASPTPFGRGLRAGLSIQVDQYQLVGLAGEAFGGGPTDPTHSSGDDSNFFHRCSSSRDAYRLVK